MQIHAAVGRMGLGQTRVWLDGPRSQRLSAVGDRYDSGVFNEQ